MLTIDDIITTLPEDTVSTTYTRKQIKITKNDIYKNPKLKPILEEKYFEDNYYILFDDLSIAEQTEVIKYFLRKNKILKRTFYQFIDDDIYQKILKYSLLSETDEVFKTDIIDVYINTTFIGYIGTPDQTVLPLQTIVSNNGSVSDKDTLRTEILKSLKMLSFKGVKIKEMVNRLTDIGYHMLNKNFINILFKKINNLIEITVDEVYDLIDDYNTNNTPNGVSLLLQSKITEFINPDFFKRVFRDYYSDLIVTTSTKYDYIDFENPLLNENPLKEFIDMKNGTRFLKNTRVLNKLSQLNMITNYGGNYNFDTFLAMIPSTFSDLTEELLRDMVNVLTSDITDNFNYFEMYNTTQSYSDFVVPQTEFKINLSQLKKTQTYPTNVWLKELFQKYGLHENFHNTIVGVIRHRFTDYKITMEDLRDEVMKYGEKRNFNNLSYDDTIVIFDILIKNSKDDLSYVLDKETQKKFEILDVNIDVSKNTLLQYNTSVKDFVNDTFNTYFGVKRYSQMFDLGNGNNLHDYIQTYNNVELVTNIYNSVVTLIAELNGYFGLNVVVLEDLKVVPMTTLTSDDFEVIIKLIVENKKMEVISHI
jgi:hypothetical protein